MKQFLIRRIPVIALSFLPGLIFAQASGNADLASSYKRYLNTYEQPPVAAGDNITGESSRTATGSVLSNDYDPAGKNMTAYLIAGSPDGKVTLAANGSFTFVPNSDFTGSSTTFSYKVCNNSLCSETATVTLHFPASTATPVLLADFMANYTYGNNVVLNWATSFENNNDHFDVERSTDGVHFSKIGTVKGQGTTNLTTNYTFTNRISRQTSSKTDIYYRLKQVSSDERVSVSKVLVVRVYNTKALEMVSVTPNPAVNDIKVNVQLNESSFVVMKVLKNDGSEVIRKSGKSGEGLNSYTLEGSSRLEKGIYFLEMIVNSKERMLVKLLKE